MNEFGLSGYLAPDGEWYPCGYQEHRDKAVELVEAYKLKETDYNTIAMGGEFIKFGTAPWAGKEGNNMCHVFMDRLRKPTQPQIDWLRENLNGATDIQKKEVLFNFSTFHEMELDLI